MRPFAAVFLCCLAALVLPPPAAAVQRSPPVEGGARVRLHARGLGGPLVGTVTAAEPDTLIVRLDGEGAGLIVPIDSIIKMHVRGERDLTPEGIGVGALAGALLAVVASPDWVDEYGECELPCLAYEISPDVGTRVTVLGLLGAVLGGVAGSQARVPTWRRVRVERVRVVPVSTGGVGLGVTLPF